MATLAAGLTLAMSVGAASPGAETPGKTVTVHINSANYGAIPTGLKVGDSIKWVNDDTVGHTVTARDHAFDYHLNPGQSVTQTLQKDGTFAIFCMYHPMMRGSITAAAR